MFNESRNSPQRDPTDQKIWCRKSRNLKKRMQLCSPTGSILWPVPRIPHTLHVQHLSQTYSVIRKGTQIPRVSLTLPRVPFIIKRSFESTAVTDGPHLDVNERKKRYMDKLRSSRHASFNHKQIIETLRENIKTKDLTPLMPSLKNI